MLKPPRIDVLPLVPGEYAKPMRGMKSLLGAVGALNVQHTPGITLGSLAIAFRDCCVQPNGTVRYSYRNPKIQAEVASDLPDVVRVPAIHLVVARVAHRAKAALGKAGA